MQPLVVKISEPQTRWCKTMLLITVEHWTQVCHLTSFPPTHVCCWTNIPHSHDLWWHFTSTVMTVM